MTTEKYDILNRFTGAVTFSAEITCSPNDPPSLKLGFAVKAAIAAKADLRSADLSFADLSSANLRSANLSFADLSSANLRSADLSSANLSSADLRSANLSFADLSSADLSSADLSSADLKGEKLARMIARADRLNDPYGFFALELEAGGYKILAGCQWNTDAEYRAHIAEDYPDTDKAVETLAILDFFVARAEALGVSK